MYIESILNLGSTLVSVGEVFKKVTVVENDKIEVHEFANVNCTIDHRYINGGKAKLIKKQVIIN